MKDADACSLIISMMKDDILASDMIGIDETPLQVLKSPRKMKSYMWIFRGGPTGKPIVLFFNKRKKGGRPFISVPLIYCTYTSSINNDID